MSTTSAGSDHTRMPLSSRVMAALYHSDAIAKAREEADALCGGIAGRLPVIRDIPKMPYTCALVKEVLCWRPQILLIPQDRLTQDLEFKSYHFLAGTESLMSSIPIAHDGDGPSADGRHWDQYHHGTLGLRWSKEGLRWIQTCLDATICGVCKIVVLFWLCSYKPHPREILL